jgi:predicted MFS family arabinose efflux permease
MALYQAIFLGGTPLGAPLIGWVGDAWGPRWTLAIGAIACALTVVVAVGYLVRQKGWGILPWHHAEEDVVIDTLEEAR